MRNFFKQWLAVAISGALILVFGLVAARADSQEVRHSPVLKWTVEQMNAQIDGSFFVVNAGCSGTLVKAGDEPIVLTAEHCVDDLFEEFEREVVDKDDGTVTKKTVKLAVPGTIRQRTFNGPLEVTEKSYRVKVLASDKKRDLALVQALAPITGTPPKIACEPLTRGEHVTIVGNPFGDLYAAVGEGIVSSTQRTYRSMGVDQITSGNMDQGLVQISPGVVGGNSGGPVYDDYGRVVGVVVRGYQMNEVLGFAVPLEEVHAFLKSAAMGQLIKHCEKSVDGTK